MNEPERWQWPSEIFARMRPDLLSAAAPVADARPCGCTADPAVFGHTCGAGVHMSADAQTSPLPSPPRRTR